MNSCFATLVPEGTLPKRLVSLRTTVNERNQLRRNRFPKLVDAAGWRYLDGRSPASLSDSETVIVGAATWSRVDMEFLDWLVPNIALGLVLVFDFTQFSNESVGHNLLPQVDRLPTETPVVAIYQQATLVGYAEGLDNCRNLILKRGSGI